MADDESKVLAEAKKLPWGERVEHKNWKVRSEAFEDLQSAYGRAFNSSDPVFQETGEREGGRRPPGRWAGPLAGAAGLTQPLARNCRPAVRQGRG